MKKNDLKHLLPLLKFFIVLGVLIFGIRYWINTTQYIYLDVNLGIELEVNKLRRIVSVKSVNEESQSILENYSPKNKNRKKIVTELLDILIIHQYLIPSEDNHILISATDEKYLEELSQIISMHLRKKQLPFQVWGQQITVHSSFIQDAESIGITTGKMTLISTISDFCELPAITLSQLSMNELISHMREHQLLPENKNTKKGYLDLPSILMWQAAKKSENRT